MARANRARPPDPNLVYDEVVTLADGGKAHLVIQVDGVVYFALRGKTTRLAVADLMPLVDLIRHGQGAIIVREVLGG